MLSAGVVHVKACASEHFKSGNPLVPQIPGKHEKGLALAIKDCTGWKCPCNKWSGYFYSASGRQP